jgi:hypothetical protein
MNQREREQIGYWTSLKGGERGIGVIELLMMMKRMTMPTTTMRWTMTKYIRGWGRGREVKGVGGNGGIRACKDDTGLGIGSNVVDWPVPVE